MSDEKMREMFERDNPVPEGLAYQDFTDMYGPAFEGANFSPISRSSYNRSWYLFQQGWDARGSIERGREWVCFECLEDEWCPDCIEREGL